MAKDAHTDRKSIRFSPEDQAWLAEHAEDEGVEPATLVRMIINRLRRGRPPLMSMALAPQMRAPASLADRDLRPGRAEYHPTADFRPDPVIDGDGAGDVVEDVLQSRLEELDGSNIQQLYADDGTGDELTRAAIPLRRVGRQNYNPGRN